MPGAPTSGIVWGASRPPPVSLFQPGAADVVRQSERPAEPLAALRPVPRSARSWSGRRLVRAGPQRGPSPGPGAGGRSGPGAGGNREAPAPGGKSDRPAGGGVPGPGPPPGREGRTPPARPGRGGTGSGGRRPRRRRLRRHRGRGPAAADPGQGAAESRLPAACPGVARPGHRDVPGRTRAEPPRHPGRPEQAGRRLSGHRPEGEGPAGGKPPWGRITQIPSAPPPAWHLSCEKGAR